MAIRRSQVVLTVGSGGTASGKTRTIDGVIHAIHFGFSPSFDATQTITVQEAGNSPALPIITLTNVNTSGWYYPRISLHDPTGSAIIGPVDYQSIADEVSVSIANGTLNDVLTVTIVWDDQRR